MALQTPCPVLTALSVVGGKWKPLILFLIRNESKRFSEIKRTIPDISQKMLTQHLRELEEDGIVNRQIFPVVPPHVEYSLTEFGKTLQPMLDALAEWGGVYQGYQATTAKQA